MTSKRLNPNRKPFPRAYLIETYVTDAKVHPLVREAKEPYYRRKNPKGFRHDLGALDIFLDNFGVLIAEQILPPHVPEEVTKHYFRELMQLLHYRWDLLGHQVIQKEPWWGKHFNSAERRANAGEPRGLLRFIGDEDWSRMRSTEISCPHNHLQDPLQQGFFEEELAVLFDEHGFHWPFEQLTGSPDRVTPGFLYDDWDYDDLIPPGYYERSLQECAPSTLDFQHDVELGGVILPPEFPPKVQEVRILHPRHATPDLALRVGRDKKSIQLFSDVVRDQQDLGTCVSHAVCVGLDIIARRSGNKRKVRFSPAWLHCASGDQVEEGRRLSDAVAVIQQGLPCEERTFPYEASELRKLNCNGRTWETKEMMRSSQQLTSSYGPPLVRRLDCSDINLIKTHLAAGWVVVVTTMLTKEFCGYGFQEYGLPLCPLKGQYHLPTGHAWLLVGYEHADGNDKWKYQGRFLALNSWGQTFPRTPGLGRGICTLPFAMFLTEGLEAFALRF